MGIVNHNVQANWIFRSDRGKKTRFGSKFYRSVVLIVFSADGLFEYVLLFSWLQVARQLTEKRMPRKLSNGTIGTRLTQPLRINLWFLSTKVIYKAQTYFKIDRILQQPSVWQTGCFLFIWINLLNCLVSIDKPVKLLILLL